MTIETLRRFAIARSLFAPTTLGRAVARLGYVQADPIRAPARAQDLILRHRVRNYVAGDLGRRYPKLDIEEDFFVNYGFVTRALRSIMHPRPSRLTKQARDVIAFIREHGAVHPREVDEHFAHGTVRNYWGGSSNATTHLMDKLHYDGHLRVVRREAGIRVYAVRELLPKPETSPAEQVDVLVDAVVNLYAPLPAATLSQLVHRLRYPAPHLREHLKHGLARAKHRLARVSAAGTEWYWPVSEKPRRRAEPPDAVRLLAPFDPVVWDRRRFELFWNWAYRFEAYTPVPKRKLGYYALPMLWRDEVVGWANLSVVEGELQADFGYIGAARPPEAAITSELTSMKVFLGLARDVL